jgi:hypothetical protein
MSEQRATKRRPKALEAHTDETEKRFRKLTKALKPFSPVAQHSAVATYALSLALKAKSAEETAQWLETLAQGVRDGDISLSSGLSIN